MKLFGFEIKRQADDDEKLQSFAPEIGDDGAVLVAASGFSTSAFVDLDGTLKNEAELVNRYRDLAQHPEIDIAIKNIVNEAIVHDDIEKMVSIDLEDIQELPPKLKEVIEQEFDNILGLLQFQKYGYETFKRWYIDGREYFHIIVDENPAAQQANGIKEIRYLDPRKIRKIRVVKKKKKQINQGTTATDQVDTQSEYYIYNEKGFNQKDVSGLSNNASINGIKIAKDSIIHLTSGLTNQAENLVLGYLHKALKPMNQLKCLEDASIIHSLSRAPQRRVFNIEIGNLPKNKAEQYVADMMIKHKNQLKYDQNNGQITDQRKFMSMNEDFWFPTRNGIGNKIETLPPGPNIAESMNIEYFQKKVFTALDVPFSRLSNDGGGGFDSRATEISRDELNFQKFIDRLRLRFSDLFVQALEKQLILKGYITPEDWDTFSNKIKFKFARDNYFTELKDREIIAERINLMNQMMPLIGTFYSEIWVKKNILRLTDEDIEKMEIEMNGEINSRMNQQRAMESGLGQEQGTQPDGE